MDSCGFVHFMALSAVDGMLLSVLCVQHNEGFYLAGAAASSSAGLANGLSHGAESTTPKARSQQASYALGYENFSAYISDLREHGSNSFLAFKDSRVNLLVARTRCSAIST